MSLESFARTRMGHYFTATSEAQLRATLASEPRETILLALKENDPNGLYLDESQEDEAESLSHGEAIDLVVQLWTEER